MTPICTLPRGFPSLSTYTCTQHWTVQNWDTISLAGIPLCIRIECAHICTARNVRARFWGWWKWTRSYMAQVLEINSPEAPIRQTLTSCWLAQIVARGRSDRMLCLSVYAADMYTKWVGCMDCAWGQNSMDGFLDPGSLTSTIYGRY